MKAGLTAWIPEDELKTPEAQAEFIQSAIEEKDPAFLAESFAVVARAQGRPVEAAACDGLAAYLRATASAKSASVAKRRRRAHTAAT